MSAFSRRLRALCCCCMFVNTKNETLVSNNSFLLSRMFNVNRGCTYILQWFFNKILSVTATEVISPANHDI
jgi:hypothetical protein